MDACTTRFNCRATSERGRTIVWPPFLGSITTTKNGNEIAVEIEPIDFFRQWELDRSN